MNHSTPGLPVHHKLPEFTQTQAHWVDDTIQPSHPLSSPSPASNPSQYQGLFQWVNSLHRWPKYWSFSFSISPSNEHPGLISFRMDWITAWQMQGKWMILPYLVRRATNSLAVHMWVKKEEKWRKRVKEGHLERIKNRQLWPKNNLFFFIAFFKSQKFNVHF